MCGDLKRGSIYKTRGQRAEDSISYSLFAVSLCHLGIWVTVAAYKKVGNVPFVSICMKQSEKY